MTAPFTITTGTIIWADLRRPDGTTAGDHPAVVLSAGAEIATGADLRVAGCTTNPAPAQCVQSGWYRLPSKPGPGGDPVTGLEEACIVKATWLCVVPRAAVRKVSKRAPARIVKQLLNWITDKEREAARRSEGRP